MAMVSVVYWQSTGGLMAQPDRLPLGPKGGAIYLSHEPGEFSQCFNPSTLTVAIWVQL